LAVVHRCRHTGQWSRRGGAARRSARRGAGVLSSCAVRAAAAAVRPSLACTRPSRARPWRLPPLAVLARALAAAAVSAAVVTRVALEHPALPHLRQCAFHLPCPADRRTPPRRARTEFLQRRLRTALLSGVPGLGGARVVAAASRNEARRQRRPAPWPARSGARCHPRSRRAHAPRCWRASHSCRPWSRPRLRGSPPAAGESLFQPTSWPPRWRGEPSPRESRLADRLDSRQDGSCPTARSSSTRARSTTGVCCSRPCRCSRNRTTSSVSGRRWRAPAPPFPRRSPDRDRRSARAQCVTSSASCAASVSGVAPHRWRAAGR